MVSKYYWKVDSAHNVITKVDGKRLSMHSLILGDGIYKHINGDKFDNRKYNLKHIRHFKNNGKTFLNGYIAIYYPEHSRAFDNGCVYEHYLIAEKILGRKLYPSECVHHIDKDRTNNQENNLMVFKTNNDHIAFHGGHIATKLEDGTYICDINRYKYLYNNRTKKDIDENKPDPGDVTIICKIESDKDLCPICNENYKTKKAKMCIKCRNKEKSKNIPSKNELEKTIYKLPFTRIGNMYGVTDNAVRRWCKKYNLPYKKKDMRMIQNIEI